MSGYPVVTKIEQPLVLNITEVANPTTTQGTLTLPTDALWVEFKYVQKGGTAHTGTVLYVVPNAYSTAEAAVKLATVGQRIPVTFGEPLRLDFSPSDPCTRIDYASDAASESGALLIISWGTNV